MTCVVHVQEHMLACNMVSFTYPLFTPDTPEKTFDQFLKNFSERSILVLSSPSWRTCMCTWSDPLPLSPYQVSSLWAQSLLRELIFQEFEKVRLETSLGPYHGLSQQTKVVALLGDGGATHPRGVRFISFVARNIKNSPYPGRYFQTFF